MFYGPRPPGHWSQPHTPDWTRQTERRETREKTENLSAPRDAPPLTDEASPSRAREPHEAALLRPSRINFSLFGELQQSPHGEGHRVRFSLGDWTPDTLRAILFLR